MKLINQSFEILEQKDFTITGIKKFIERCGRVCYKSEDRITEDSYEKFVNMLESRGHDRPLEFGTVHLKMILPDFEGFIHSLLIVGMLNNIWIKHAYKGDVIYITTNYRYYLDIIKYFPNVRKYLTEEDNEYYPKRYTVHFITSRGIMDEFRTHVGLSHLAESTRYCNYSKDKFNNELTFIIPCWMDIPEGSINLGNYDKTSAGYSDGNIHIIDNKPPYVGVDFIRSLCEAEYSYLSIVRNGWTPQQAREVLPLAIKSELISCGFEDAWKNFFYRRCAKDAHPMAREIANKLHEEFTKRQILKSK
jgi:thymidylate synthase (FAD)